MRCICRNMLRIHKRIFENKCQKKMLHILSTLYFGKAIHHFNRRSRASHHGTMVIMCKKVFQNKKAVFFCTLFLQQWINKYNAINTWDNHKWKIYIKISKMDFILADFRWMFFKVIPLQIHGRQRQKAPQSISAQSDVTFQIKSPLKIHQLTLCRQISDSHEKKTCCHWLNPLHINGRQSQKAPQSISGQSDVDFQNKSPLKILLLHFPPSLIMLLIS